MTGEAPDRERVHRLMMAALDGEIAPGERHELEELVAADAALRKEWETMKRVKEVTSGMSLREPPAETWEGYWDSVYNRAERGLGWILFSLGAIALVAYGGLQVARDLMSDPEVPLLLKAAITALAVGGAALVVSVVRERVFARRSDPYKEVKR